MYPFSGWNPRKWSDQLRRHNRANEIIKQVNNSYMPMFTVRSMFQEGMVVLKWELDTLNELVEDLLSSEGKDEAQQVKEKWQAIQLSPTLEHYEIAMDNLKELLDSIPEPPKPLVEYKIEYNPFDWSGDA